MRNSNPTGGQIKQHYLPECYLKEFCNSDGKLHTLDINLLAYGKDVFDEQRYPVSVCRGKHFYTIRPEYSSSHKHLEGMAELYLENQFRDYEEKYPALIQKIKRGQSYLGIEDARLLVYVLFDLKIRNKYFRDTTVIGLKETVFDEVAENFKKEIEQIDLTEFPNLSKEGMLAALERERLIHIADEHFAEKTHVASLTKRKTSDNKMYRFISGHLLQFDWLIMTCDQGFLTTDNPGVSVDKTGKIQNTKFDQDFCFLFPLTHSHCICITPEAPDKNYKPDSTKKRLSYGKAPEHTVELINSFHGIHLSQHIFASNKKLIDSAADNINAKAKKDRAEKADKQNKYSKS